MFGVNLTLPEHVHITLDPNPEDEGRTFLLVISARGIGPGEPLKVQKTIPRNVGAIQFGKDLLAAINHLHGLLKKREG